MSYKPEKETRKALKDTIGCHITSADILTSSGSHSLLLDLVDAKHRLYSVKLEIHPKGKATTSFERNGSFTPLSQFMSLKVLNLIIYEDSILLCTNDVYLDINMKEGKWYILDNKTGYNLQCLRSVEYHGF